MPTYTIPTLPPLPPYPAGPEDATAQAAWREMARLMLSIEEVTQREQCHAALLLLQASLPPMVENVLARWEAHDAKIDLLTAAISNVRLEGGTTTGLPIELVTALLVAIVAALRPSA